MAPWIFSLPLAKAEKPLTVPFKIPRKVALSVMTSTWFLSLSCGMIGPTEALWVLKR